MSLLKNIFLRVKNFFFPRLCAICENQLIDAGEIRHGLCEECGASFETVQGEKCGLCGRPLVSEREFCLSCRNGAGRSYDRLWVLFPYTGKYRRLLTAYKFNKNTSLANFLAEKVTQLIDGDPVLREAGIVPVPPRPGKIKESGWDQVEYLVRRLEKIDREKIKVCRCLKRQKSKVQKMLGRTERAENLKGRIQAHGEVPKTAIVIDDVITTGSTIEECSRTLKENGAEKVFGLCLFYN
ncbi:MAG: ComF family protein [Treponema sp.]|jgi:ComF family protein|nr:ComF family protein [Treponema sp.]